MEVTTGREITAKQGLTTKLHTGNPKNMENADLHETLFELDVVSSFQCSQAV
jgi:hypothetical protein